MTQPTGAAALLRAVGLLADGPAVWGRPVPAHGPGVFIIELPAPLASAPIELTRVGKWIERVEGLRLDGAPTTSRALATRLGAFWLPSQSVLYVGTSTASIARRVSAMVATELGDRKPASGGHWLKALRSLEDVKVWWAATTATEEYEDALFGAFAEGVSVADLTLLPDRAVVLPWANLRRPDGARKPTGLSGSLNPEPVATPPPATRLVQVPDGDAEGARGEPPAPKRKASVPRASRRAKEVARKPADAASPILGSALPAEALTADGEGRLRAELDDLTTFKRREVIARIRTAKEHGDLKENAEYHAAREEQSFLEGRVQAIEARLRSAVIVEAPVAGSSIGLGSVVTLEDDGETVTYTIVGADDSDPMAGRISSSSPVGRALVGRTAGDEIVVKTPAGNRAYRILEVG